VELVETQFEAREATIHKSSLALQGLRSALESQRCVGRFASLHVSLQQRQVIIMMMPCLCVAERPPFKSAPADCVQLKIRNGNQQRNFGCAA